MPSHSVSSVDSYASFAPSTAGSALFQVPIKTQVTGCDTQDYTLYQFVVVAGVTTWSVRKRFSNFVQLHTTLKRRFPMIDLPALPPKKVFGRTSEKTINRRKTELQGYIERIMAIPELASSEIVMNFLEASSNSASELGAIQQRVEYMSKANSDTLNQLREREAENSALIRQIDRLKGDNEALRENNRRYHDEVKSLQPRVAEQSQQLEETCHRLISVTKSHEAKTAEYNRLLEKSEALKLQLVSTNTQYTMLKKELSDRDEEERQASSLSRVMERDTCKHENTLMELRRKSNANLEKIHVIQTKLARSRSDLVNVMDAIRQVSDEIEFAEAERAVVPALPMSLPSNFASTRVDLSRFSSRPVNTPPSPSATSDGPRLRSNYSPSPTSPVSPAHFATSTIQTSRSRPSDAFSSKRIVKTTLG